MGENPKYEVHTTTGTSCTAQATRILGGRAKHTQKQQT